MLNNILRWWRSIRFFRYFVIADGSDNSITLSRKLYKHIELLSHKSGTPKVFVFKVKSWQSYGFSINPPLEQETELADLQYNEKYRTIGFQSLCPSVQSIFYSYGLPADAKIKLTVTVHPLNGDTVFYNIERPRL